MPNNEIKIAYLGTNPIAGKNDHPIKWKNRGTGYAYYDKEELLINQPCKYGLLESKVVGNIVFQTFYSLHGKSESWTRAGNSKGWYAGSKKWIQTISVASKNKSYPDYDDKWKWCKYNDGSFKAEYKRMFPFQYLPVDCAENGIKVTKFGLKLPISVKDIDVPKWDLATEADGLIWITNIDANSEFINAKISRAFMKNDNFIVTIGCTVTGRWK